MGEKKVNRIWLYWAKSNIEILFCKEKVMHEACIFSNSYIFIYFFFSLILSLILFPFFLLACFFPDEFLTSELAMLTFFIVKFNFEQWWLTCEKQHVLKEQQRQKEFKLVQKWCLEPVYIDTGATLELRIN